MLLLPGVSRDVIITWGECWRSGGWIADQRPWTTRSRTLTRYTEHIVVVHLVDVLVMTDTGAAVVVPSLNV